MIRLQRTGRENTPSYRIVVAEKSAPVKGKFHEIVGLYLPSRTPKVFEVQTERITHWISKGALPSNTLARLLRKEGMKDMDKYITTYTKRRPKGEEPPAPAAAAPTQAPAAEATAAPAEAKTEAPAEEAPKESGDSGTKEA